MSTTRDTHDARTRGRLRGSLGVSICALLYACAAPTEVHVTIDVDEALLPRERVLEVSAYDAEGTQIYRDEQLVGGTTGIALPTGLRVVPRSGADEVSLRFSLRAGPTDVRVRRDVTLAFESGQVPTPTVRLDAACEDASCPDGFTCACTEPGCATPRCVAYGLCEVDRACEDGEVQRCVEGVWAPTCEVEE